MSSEWRTAARALLRAGNGLGSSVIEDVWASVAAGASRLSRSAPRHWSTTGNERVLWVAPHPDDDAMGGAGTLLRHTRGGDRVTIVVLTDGSRSRALGLDAETMAELRRHEEDLAVARLGVTLKWEGLREDAWDDAEGQRCLQDAIAELRPTIIYSPSLIDFHPEHQRVARVLARALAESGSQPEVRVYAIQVPLTPLLVNLTHDVSDLAEPIHGVLSAYASQWESVARTMRLRRYAARFYGAGSQVEGFCAMSTADYVEFHQRPGVAFEALRIRAWSDPIAMVAGVRERMHWRRRLLAPRDPTK